MSYRPLSNSEKTALQNQGCFSSDWAKIEVSDTFSTERVHNVRFSGRVRMGSMEGSVETSQGENKLSGLYFSKIESCEIGNDVLIDHVRLLKNYCISDQVVIENVDQISVTGSSSFGNGVELEVLNEGGGRELLMYDRLTAQIAYILVCYRHDSALIETVNGMIQEYVKQKESDKGYIGKGAKILNSGSIVNVEIGSHSSIIGASLLQNGSIVSNSSAPAYIGESVIAKNFITLSGSKVDGGALIDKVFVGQGVEIGKQFSGENSVFFANSEAFHGEAVSVFAGPYTVTHHKSTLLIAGQYSFYNAGSGTNQSNHMYKLGPIHQGIIERGSKTGSFAYLLWPSRIGAYSVVMGKNPASFDSSDFPFSYINVDHEKSILTPGMNFFTVGTRRDCEKWPNRDKRKDPDKYDLINFDFLSPFIVQKVIDSLDILSALYEKASKKQETVFHKGIRIKRLMLKTTRKYYNMALSIFIGNQILGKLEEIDEPVSIETIRDGFITARGENKDQWIDMAGMIAPARSIENLLSDIKSGAITSLEDISATLVDIHGSYNQHVWAWTTEILAERFEVDVNSVNADQLLELISTWETESIKLDKMILNDASKEFDNSSKIGFGIDGDQDVIDRDFDAVRGVPEENKFITGIHNEIREIEKKAASLRNILEHLK